MRRILSSDAPISLLVTLWLATLVSCNSQSVTEKLATFHKPLVGVPRINSPGLSPILHHLPLRDGKVLGYLFTGTTKNVLAGLDPVGGSVVWRHILDDDDILDEFRPNHDGIIALSGYELQNVRLHEVKNGNIIWEAQLPATQADRLPDFQCIGSCITFATDGTPDVFISSNTGGIHRLNGLTGATKWTWTPVDYAPITPLSKVIATPTKIYFIHFLESSGSYKIHITTINQENGEQLSTQALSASVSDPISDAILVGNPKSNQATLVWAGQDEAKFIRLSTLQEGTAPQSLAGYKKVADTRLGPNGLFVALKADGSSAIMRLDPEDSQWIKTHWAFKDSASSPSRSESIFTGGFDKQGRPHVSRTYWSNRVRACSVELYVPHDNISTGFNFPFDTVHHGVILHVNLVRLESHSSS
ncbi:hypothetical protein FRB90_012166 [Tulasnella sp. 427]|nr:hypothetical protein FRB90_012166 [Tulasnella sp. 427]